MQHITHPAAVGAQGLAPSTRTVLSEPRLMLYCKTKWEKTIGYDVCLNHHFSSHHTLKVLGTIVVKKSIFTAKT